VKPDDLSKLRIERAPSAAPRVRRRWGRAALVGSVIAAAIAFGVTRYAAPVPVETVTVTLAYPSQNFTLLNATGYVVPQRKASLSSKATGRLEWLGVLEGSRIKAGEVIAKLESRDVQATLAQAEAQVNVAIANQQQGAAELRDAEANFRRSKELLEKKFISGAQHDADVARLGKARAAIASQKAGVASAEANRRAAEVGV
jgi:HlyD family secretion protein